VSDEQGWTPPGAAPGDPGVDRHRAYPGTDPVAGPVPSPPPPPSGAPTGPPAGAAAAAVPPPYAPPYAEYRPGIVPLRPLTLSEIWSGVMTAIRGNPAATIGLALVTTVVVLVPLTALGAWLAGMTWLLPPLDGYVDPTDPSAAQADAVLVGQVASLVPGFATYVTAVLLPLFMAVVIGQGVQGRKVGLGETWRAARGRIPAALGVFFTVAFVAFVGLAVLGLLVVIAYQLDSQGAFALAVVGALVVAVIGLVLLSVRWGFATTIVVLENLGPWKAMTRSWVLTRKRGFWRIFGIRLLTGIVATIAVSVITTPLSFGASFFVLGDPASPNPAMWILPVVQAVVVLIQSVLTTPFVSGVDSLLYVDQRIRYEGLDVQLVQQAHASPAS
jgi:hypothetical protein